ncbi:retrovirus-related pol polyprotein from transposon TNT 1-94 [Tanacetum coccineum]
MSVQGARQKKIMLIRGASLLELRLETECYLRVFSMGREWYDYGQEGKLAPRLCGIHFEIVKSVGRWALIAEPDVQVPPLDLIKIDVYLSFVKSIEIVDGKCEKIKRRKENSLVKVLKYEDWTGAVTDINEDGLCHPIVTIPLLPDFGGVTVLKKKTVLHMFGTKDWDISARRDYRHTTQGVIDYVYSDLWGPSQVESLRGKRYFLSFIDDYSKREFEQLCIESGIARHLIVFRTPQQNGSPSTAIEKKIPMEMWSGHPSDYGMLRIFGCVAYPHDKQGKLEPRAIKCILLGYPEGVKADYIGLIMKSPKIVTSRNVVFNESVMYKDTLKNSGTGNTSVEELQVVVELQRLNNHTPEEDQTDQEDGNDEDAGDQETDQPPDLTNYQLVCDREPRTRTKPLRF